MSGHLSIIGSVVSPLVSPATFQGVAELSHSEKDVAERWANGVAGLQRSNALFSFATRPSAQPADLSKAFQGLGAFFALTLGNTLKLAFSPVITAVSLMWLLGQLCFLDGCYKPENLKRAALFTLFPMFTLLFLVKSFVGMFTAFFSNVGCDSGVRYAAVGATGGAPASAADDS